VLRALFDVAPAASVYTSMARYVGKQGFESTYPDTAYQNIGSQMMPAYMPELCDCPSDHYAHEYAHTVRPTADLFDVSTRLQAIDNEFGWGDAQVMTFGKEQDS